MITREDNPQDWFLLAKDRPRGADILHGSEGVTYLGLEALPEAVERFLKGYLVDQGWKLVRTHDLTVLLDATIGFEPTFRQFAGFTESLTDQFWAQHYPGGDLEDFGVDYPELRKQTGRLIELILKGAPDQ